MRSPTLKAKEYLARGVHGPKLKPKPVEWVTGAVTDFSEHIRKLSTFYGGVREVSRRLGVGYSYLRALRDGELNKPGSSILEALCLAKTRDGYKLKRIPK